MKMDLWVVSFNLSVHFTVPLQQKLFKNCFRGIEMFNPLYCKEWYTHWWLDIGCCVTEASQLLAKIIRERRSDSHCTLLAHQQMSNYEGRARFECSIVSVKPAINLHCVAPMTKYLESDSNCCSLPSLQFNGQCNQNDTAKVRAIFKTLNSAAQREKQ